MRRDKPREDLTPRQAETLAIISRLTGARRLPPTIRELGVALGVGSTNAVNDLLRALARKGCVFRGRNMARALFITPRGRDALKLRGLAGRWERCAR